MQQTSYLETEADGVGRLRDTFGGPKFSFDLLSIEYVFQVCRVLGDQTFVPRSTEVELDLSQTSHCM